MSDRSPGAVSVVSFATRRVVETWVIPGGIRDMGNVSANGRVLWLSGRYDGSVYDDRHPDRKAAGADPGRGRTARLVRLAPPGRYSLGHTASCSEPVAGFERHRSTGADHLAGRLRNLKVLTDIGSNFAGAPDLESHHANAALGLEQSALSCQRVPPGDRFPFGHTHKTQEEVYVVVWERADEAGR